MSEHEKRFDADHEKADTDPAAHAEYAKTGAVPIEPRAQRRLLLKQDALILPLTVLLYLSAYLDRGNVGNARYVGRPLVRSARS